MMFDGTGTQPVQMDVSMTRVSRAAGKGRLLLCADGYELPFADESFEAVLLVAVLEHTREPWRMLAEARRVLKPGGKVDHGRAQRLDDERRPAAAGEVSRFAIPIT